MTTLFFSTVVRAAPLHEGGEVVRLDWASKQVEARAPVRPLNEALRDRNPRGNSRGGRGIWLTEDAVYVAAYDGIRVFDHRLQPRSELTNGLMVGLHEVFMTEQKRLWVAATAVDALLEIDLTSGAIVGEYWPREVPAFQKAFGVEIPQLDKTADQRAAFLDPEHAHHPSHLHLNALARWRGSTLGLLNRFGAVIDLDHNEVVVRDKVLRGGHNLVVREDIAAVCATSDYSVRLYDLDSGQPLQAFGLARYPELAHLLAGRRRARVSRAVQRVAQRAVIAKPLFVRGLDLVGTRLFVGFSPASIACIDLTTGDLVDFYQYSDDVRVCVHGLRLVGSDTLGAFGPSSVSDHTDAGLAT